MAVCYKKLFHLMIEKYQILTAKGACSSANVITRMERDQYISLESVERHLSCYELLRE